MKKSQQKFLPVLFFSALILLLANVLVKRFEGEPGGNILFLQEDVEFSMHNSLKSFGIKDEWIKKKVLQSKDSQEDYPFLIISVPVDLPIPVILLDITNQLRNDSVKVECIEKKSGDETVLTVSINSRLLLQAKLTYSEKIRREEKTIAFLVEDVLPESAEDSVLIESTDRFTLLMYPTAENLKHIRYLTDQRKDFSVLINDEINDPTYRLHPSYSKLRVLNVVKALSANYSDAAFFVVDDKSDFYKSSQYDFFYKEMEKRRIGLYKISDFIDMREDENLSENFNNYLSRADSSSALIYLLSKDDYLLLKPLILHHKKKGTKVINIPRLL